MSNTFIPERFDEVVHRLAAGVVVVDPVRRSGWPSGLRVTLDAPREPPDRRPILARTEDFQRRLAPFSRHESGRFALRHAPTVPAPLDIRIVDGTGRRRVVPRRLRLPVIAWDDLVATEADLDGPQPGAAGRRFELALHPGAGYDLPSGLTALRGLATTGAEPLRWCRVEAFRPASNGTPEVPVGVAHGDDRGEWLLGLDTRRLRPSEVPDPFPVVLRLHGRLPPEPPAEPTAYLAGTFLTIPTTEPARYAHLRARVADPLWDLPIELVTVPPTDDPVAAGVAVPDELSQWSRPDTPVSVPHGRTTVVAPLAFLP